jgi:nucleoid DNA-binding protein
MANNTKPAPKAQPKKVAFPTKTTANTIIQYVAEKNEMSKKQAKDIIDDLYAVVNAGAMNGERVPMGNFGKLFIKIKPATKARMGRNPLTGAEIKIAAKKATKVPKFSFGKGYKEAALKAKVK